MGNGRTTEESAIPAVYDTEIVEPLVRVEPRLEIALSATRENLAPIRETAERFLAPEFERRGCRERLPEVLVALQEASSNVVRHAYRDQDEPGSIVVRAELLPTLLRLTVLDEGPGYDPAGVAPPDPVHPRDGGYGLHLIRAIMPRVVYSRRGGRNSLLMEAPLRASEGERLA